MDDSTENYYLDDSTENYYLDASTEDYYLDDSTEDGDDDDLDDIGEDDTLEEIIEDKENETETENNKVDTNSSELNFSDAGYSGTDDLGSSSSKNRKKRSLSDEDAETEEDEEEEDEEEEDGEEDDADEDEDEGENENDSIYTDDDFIDIYETIYNSPDTPFQEKILLESLERVRRVVNNAGGIELLKKGNKVAHKIVKRQLKTGEACNLFSRRRRSVFIDYSHMSDIEKEAMKSYNTYLNYLGRHSDYISMSRSKRGINNIGKRLEDDNAGYRQLFKEYKNMCNYLAMAVFNKK